jgi:glutamyl-tRNA reductase
MQISLVGLSHHTAPVEVRERLHFSERDLPAALQALHEREAVTEGIIFSTCNRVEVLARLEDGAEAVPVVAEFLAGTRRVEATAFAPLLYERSQRDAVRHIFRVSSSLDSLVVGEPQILGQVKAAYAAARAVGTVGSVLDEVMTHAFAAAKKVRAQTGIATTAVSVSYAAVELARKIFGSLQGKNVFLIGAGEMSELAAEHLMHALERADHPVRRPAELHQPGRHCDQLHRSPGVHHSQRARATVHERAQRPPHVLHRHCRAARHRSGAKHPEQHFSLQHRRPAAGGAGQPAGAGA